MRARRKLWVHKCTGVAEDGLTYWESGKACEYCGMKEEPGEAFDVRHPPGIVESWLADEFRRALRAQLAERGRMKTYPPSSARGWRRWLKVCEEVRVIRRLLKQARKEAD